MSEPLQKVIRYIIFEVLGNLIQRVINSSHNSIAVLMCSDGAEGEVHIFPKFVCLLVKQPTGLEDSEIYPTFHLQPEN